MSARNAKVFMVLAGLLGIGTALAQGGYGFSIAVVAIRETADRRDADGALRAALLQIESAASWVNRVATSATVREGELTEGAIAEVIPQAQEAISRAMSLLEGAEWSADEGVPVAALQPWVPDEILATRDPYKLVDWIIARLGPTAAGLDLWATGNAPPETIFAVQSELNRSTEILARLVGATQPAALPPDLQ